MSLDLQIHSYAVGFASFTYSFVKTLIFNERINVVNKVALFSIGFLSPTFIKQYYFDNSKPKDCIILTQALKKSFPDFFSDIDINDLEKVTKRVKKLIKELKKREINSLDELDVPHIQDILKKIS